MHDVARPPGPNIRSAIPLQWQDNARCHGRQFSTFFPEDYIDPVKDEERFEIHVRLVRRYFCNRCPVRQACFQHSMRLREAAGIWGGVGVRERRLWLRNRTPYHGRTPEQIRQTLKEEA